jgi:GxxExxY protein
MFLSVCFRVLEIELIVHRCTQMNTDVFVCLFYTMILMVLELVFMMDYNQDVVTPDEFDRLTSRIIRCAYTVSNVLGSGFLEKVYENSLAYELKKNGLQVEQQYRIGILYDGILVGEYFADLLVERCILVELKAVKALDGIHFSQCLNYLKATHLRVCLLMNFGNPKVEIKRIMR